MKLFLFTGALIVISETLSGGKERLKITGSLGRDAKLGQGYANFVENQYTFLSVKKVRVLPDGALLQNYLF